MKPTGELLQQLKSAAQEEIMCREASDTSDAWQDLASPENILALIEISLPVLEQQGGWIKCTDRLPDVGDNVIIFDGEEVVAATLAGLGVKFDGSAVFWGFEEGYAGKVRFYSEFWMPKPAPPASCFKCGGTGQMDSGGTQPWGDAIMVSCDCQPSTDTYRQIENDG